MNKIFRLFILTLCLSCKDHFICAEAKHFTSPPRSTRIGSKEQYIESDKKMRRFLLITGCCYSGTEYMSKFLQASGLDVEHEYMNSEGCVSWLMASRIKSTPWGPLSINYKFDHVFHQVRSPIKVIQSVYNFFPVDLWPWIYDVVPEIKRTDPLLVRSVKYWYYWNLLCEDVAEWRFRIEDFDVQYEEMAERLGLQFDDMVLGLIDKGTNKKDGKIEQVTWEMLKQNLDSDFYEKVCNLTRRYGYHPVD